MTSETRPSLPRTGCWGSAIGRSGAPPQLRIELSRYTPRPRRRRSRCEDRVNASANLSCRWDSGGYRRNNQRPGSVAYTATRRVERLALG
jgi:hypothetical protein